MVQATQTASSLFQAAVVADARDFLWDTAFPRFQSAGQMAPFLDCLIPHVLDGRLTALSPEVVQVCCDCTRCALAATLMPDTGLEPSQSAHADWVGLNLVMRQGCDEGTCLSLPSDQTTNPKFGFRSSVLAALC